MKLKERFANWALEKAADTRFYGADGTIHNTGYIDVEVYGGEVIAVWFRCQQLPFKQTDTSYGRINLSESYPLPEIVGIELNDK